ncbi:hypothetical protein, partial [Streptomyces clavuligerus]
MLLLAGDRVGDLADRAVLIGGGGEGVGLGGLLGAGGPGGALPVDDRDLGALTGGEGEAVQEAAERDALGRPALLGGDDHALGRAVVERQVLLTQVDRARRLPRRLALGMSVSTTEQYRVVSVGWFRVAGSRSFGVAPSSIALSTHQSTRP